MYNKCGLLGAKGNWVCQKEERLDCNKVRSCREQGKWGGFPKRMKNKMLTKEIPAVLTKQFFLSPFLLERGCQTGKTGGQTNWQNCFTAQIRQIFCCIECSQEHSGLHDSQTQTFVLLFSDKLYVKHIECLVEPYQQQKQMFSVCGLAHCCCMRYQSTHDAWMTK